MSDPFVGEIRMTAFNFAPSGWALCNGQLLSISQNQALFALIGTFYGGNGTTTFQLPDLRSRSPIHQGQGLGLSVMTIGETGGVENTSVLLNNLPAHTHTATFTPSGGGGGTPTVTVSVKGSASLGNTTSPNGNYLTGNGNLADGTNTTLNFVSGTPTDLAPIAGVSATISGVAGGGGTVTNALTGNGLPLPIRNPFLVINFVIALQGIFPSRG
jgi:microcystin-dependent protein